MNRVCLECGEKIQGRIDKKFCSDSCRNSYNNKLNSNHSWRLRNVNAILKKNRKVLEELSPGQVAKVSRTKLLQKGFDFDYLTNIYINQGVEYYFCYDYGYLPLDDEFYFLVKQKENEG